MVYQGRNLLLLRPKAIASLSQTLNLVARGMAGQALMSSLQKL